MISFDEARALVRRHRHVPSRAVLPLSEVLGLRLAEDLRAPEPSPPFDRSAMDGYAVGSPGFGPWRLTGTVAAGDAPQNRLKGDEAVRIFTGGMLPEGAAAVLPQEDARVDGGAVLASGAVSAGAHVRVQGEEYPKGARLLAAGASITPAVAAGIASVGLDRVFVEARPNVAVLSTGSELVPPGTLRGAGQVYESNSFGLAAALRSLGCRVTGSRVPDDPLATEREAAKLLDAHDLLITIGGVSVGALDYVRQAVRGAGIEPVFEGVAMKPGKPIAFGLDPRERAWFGLPGNPMSALVGYCLFVTEWLGEGPTFRDLPLAAGFSRRPGREEFVPVEVALGPPAAARPLPAVGSHANFALAGADGLARVPAVACCVEAGEVLPVTPLPWRRA